MKRFTLLFAIILVFGGGTFSQEYIEDFEHIKLNWISAGENGNMKVVPNPDTEGNSSGYVVQFTRGADGDPWAGFYTSLDTPLDVEEYGYVFVDVWKPRISPLRFKFEGGEVENIEVPAMEDQTLTEQWETIVFDFTGNTGSFPTATFFPDFEDPLTLTEDIVIYFDNIVFSDNPVPGEGNEMLLDDFEFVPMNAMLGGEEDNSFFEIVVNPDPTGANSTDHVAKFHRDKDGVPWGGFWSSPEEPYDMSTHKYVYVDVWKSRISPIKFKVEDGPGGTYELESVTPQTLTEEWETIVFHFPDADGEYPTFAFMPDFEDPVNLTEDIVIYFDNIRIGDVGMNVEDNMSITDVHFKVFPNPAGEFLNVELEAGAVVGLYNITGSLIKQQVSTGKDVVFDTSHLPGGFYMVQINKNNAVHTEKVIIK